MRLPGRCRCWEGARQKQTQGARVTRPPPLLLVHSPGVAQTTKRALLLRSTGRHILRGCRPRGMMPCFGDLLGVPSAKLLEAWPLLKRRLPQSREHRQVSRELLRAKSAAQRGGGSPHGAFRRVGHGRQARRRSSLLHSIQSRRAQASRRRHGNSTALFASCHQPPCALGAAVPGCRCCRCKLCCAFPLTADEHWGAGWSSRGQ